MALETPGRLRDMFMWVCFCMEAAIGTTRLTSRELNHDVSCEALAVATGNVQDFEEAGVVLVDPWRAYHSIPIETERNFSRPAPVMQMSRQIMPCRRQLKIAARLYALSM